MLILLEIVYFVFLSVFVSRYFSNNGNGAVVAE